MTFTDKSGVVHSLDDGMRPKTYLDVGHDRSHDRTLWVFKRGSGMHTMDAKAGERANHTSMLDDPENSHIVPNDWMFCGRADHHDKEVSIDKVGEGIRSEAHWNHVRGEVKQRWPGYKIHEFGDKPMKLHEPEIELSAAPTWKAIKPPKGSSSLLSSHVANTFHEHSSMHGRVKNAQGKTLAYGKVEKVPGAWKSSIKIGDTNAPMEASHATAKEGREHIANTLHEISHHWGGTIEHIPTHAPSLYAPTFFPAGMGTKEKQGALKESMGPAEHPQMKLPGMGLSAVLACAASDHYMTSWASEARRQEPEVMKERATAAESASSPSEHLAAKHFHDAQSLSHLGQKNVDAFTSHDAAREAHDKAHAAAGTPEFGDLSAKAKDLSKAANKNIATESRGDYGGWIHGETGKIYRAAGLQSHEAIAAHLASRSGAALTGIRENTQAAVKAGHIRFINPQPGDDTLYVQGTKNSLLRHRSTVGSQIADRVKRGGAAIVDASEGCGGGHEVHNPMEHNEMWRKIEGEGLKLSASAFIAAYMPTLALAHEQMNLFSGHSGETKVAPSSPGPSKANSQISDAEFGARAMRAGRDVANRWGEGTTALGDKVTIKHLHQEYEKAHGAYPLDEFKNRLGQVNGSHGVALVSEDMPGKLGEHLQASTVRLGKPPYASDYHYIRTHSQPRTAPGGWHSFSDHDLTGVPNNSSASQHHGNIGSLGTPMQAPGKRVLFTSAVSEIPAIGHPWGEMAKARHPQVLAERAKAAEGASTAMEHYAASMFHQEQTENALNGEHANQHFAAKLAHDKAMNVSEMLGHRDDELSRNAMTHFSREARAESAKANKTIATPKGNYGGWIHGETGELHHVAGEAQHKRMAAHLLGKGDGLHPHITETQHAIEAGHIRYVNPSGGANILTIDGTKASLLKHRDFIARGISHQLRNGGSAAVEHGQEFHEIHSPMEHNTMWREIAGDTALSADFSEAVLAMAFEQGLLFGGGGNASPRPSPTLNLMRSGNEWVAPPSSDMKAYVEKARKAKEWSLKAKASSASGDDYHAAGDHRIAATWQLSASNLASKAGLHQKAKEHIANVDYHHAEYEKHQARVHSGEGIAMRPNLGLPRNESERSALQAIKDSLGPHEELSMSATDFIATHMPVLALAPYPTSGRRVNSRKKKQSTGPQGAPDDTVALSEPSPERWSKVAGEKPSRESLAGEFHANKTMQARVSDGKGLNYGGMIHRSGDLFNPVHTTTIQRPDATFEVKTHGSEHEAREHLASKMHELHGIVGPGASIEHTAAAGVKPTAPRMTPPEKKKALAGLAEHLESGLARPTAETWHPVEAGTSKEDLAKAFKEKGTIQAAVVDRTGSHRHEAFVVYHRPSMTYKTVGPVGVGIHYPTQTFKTGHEAREELASRMHDVHSGIVAAGGKAKISHSTEPRITARERLETRKLADTAKPATSGEQLDMFAKPKETTNLEVRKLKEERTPAFHESERQRNLEEAKYATTPTKRALHLYEAAAHGLEARRLSEAGPEPRGPEGREAAINDVQHQIEYHDSQRAENIRLARSGGVGTADRIVKRRSQFRDASGLEPVHIPSERQQYLDSAEHHRGMSENLQKQKARLHIEYRNKAQDAAKAAGEMAANAADPAEKAKHLYKQSQHLAESKSHDERLQASLKQIGGGMGLENRVITRPPRPDETVGAPPMTPEPVKVEAPTPERKFHQTPSGGWAKYAKPVPTATNVIGRPAHFEAQPMTAQRVPAGAAPAPIGQKIDPAVLNPGTPSKTVPASVEEQAKWREDNLRHARINEVMAQNAATEGMRKGHLIIAAEHRRKAAEGPPAVVVPGTKATYSSKGTGNVSKIDPNKVRKDSARSRAEVMPLQTPRYAVSDNAIKHTPSEGHVGVLERPLTPGQQREGQSKVKTELFNVNEGNTGLHGLKPGLYEAPLAHVTSKGKVVEHAIEHNRSSLTPSGEYKTKPAIRATDAKFIASPEQAESTAKRLMEQHPSKTGLVAGHYVVDTHQAKPEVGYEGQKLTFHHNAEDAVKQASLFNQNPEAVHAEGYREPPKTPYRKSGYHAGRKPTGEDDLAMHDFINQSRAEHEATESIKKRAQAKREAEAEERRKRIDAIKQRYLTVKPNLLSKRPDPQWQARLEKAKSGAEQNVVGPSPRPVIRLSGQWMRIGGRIIPLPRYNRVAA